ncbi:MAG: hypothetical protein WC916_05695 [Candidatus Woesearchaeota archaeon]
MDNTTCLIVMYMQQGLMHDMQSDYLNRKILTQQGIITDARAHGMPVLYTTTRFLDKSLDIVSALQPKSVDEIFESEGDVAIYGTSPRNGKKLEHLVESYSTLILIGLNYTLKGEKRSSIVRNVHALFDYTDKHIIICNRAILDKSGMIKRHKMQLGLLFNNRFSVDDCLDITTLNH